MTKSKFRSNGLIAIFCIIPTFIPSAAIAQWVKSTTPYNDYTFGSLAIMGNTLIADCGGELFRSTDLGNTWLDANDGIEYTSDATTLFPFGPDLFALTGFNIGVAFSDDTAQSWVPRNNHGFVTGGPAMVSIGDTLILSSSQGLWRSLDTGGSWHALPCDFDTTPNTAHFGPDTGVRSLAESGGYIFAGCFLGGIFRSSDGGNTWKNVLYLLGRQNPVLSLAAFGEDIYAGTAATGIFRSSRLRNYLGFIQYWYSIDHPNSSSFISYARRHFCRAACRGWCMEII